MSVSVSTILLRSNNGCCGGFAFCEKIIDNVLTSIKRTKHAICPSTYNVKIYVKCECECVRRFYNDEQTGIVSEQGN